jgi:flagellar biosynthetic protein FliP
VIPALVTGTGQVTVNLPGAGGSPNSTVITILAITLLAVAPALLICLTAFTRIAIVLGLTRSALGLQNTPPNQVLAGLSLFLALFVMAPTLSAMNKAGLQPYLHHHMTASAALAAAEKPLRAWMLRQTRSHELAMFSSLHGGHAATSAAQVKLTTLIPAFVLSEIQSAFIIGFVIYIPFLVIDLVVSSTLMSLGMMMMPPTLVSLPFKLLLFVLVDGWTLVAHSLLTSFH